MRPVHVCALLEHIATMRSEHGSYLSEPVADPDFVRTVVDTPVEGFVFRVELVGVPDSDSGGIELCHGCQFAVAPYVGPDAEDPFDEDQGGGFGLWPEAFGIRHQQGWPEVEFGAEGEDRTRREVVHVPEIVT